MNTVLLDPQSWDLMIDASKNIAMAQEPYAVAQDAASAIRLFQGEDYYDTTRGVPYWQQILGKWPPVSLMKAKFVAAALTVPDAVKAQCFINAIEDRQVSGQVQVTDAGGNIAVAAFVSPTTPPAPSRVPPMNFSVPGNIAITAALP
jgi:hypothetical protein